MCIEAIMNYNIKNIVFASFSINKNRWNYLQYLVTRGKLDIVLNIKEKKYKNEMKKFFYFQR